jgi:hypothetical protein
MISDMRQSLLTTLTLALVACAPAFAQSSAADAAQWKPLQFLLGTWQASTFGNDVKSFGTYTFQTELNGTVLARHGSADTCKGPADFNCDHHDLLYLFHEVATGTGDNGIRAIYFDGEGHVLHYKVSTPTANSVVFQTEPGPGPQFRLTYELSGGVMTGKFQMAPPGQSEYHSYLEWKGGKK